MISRKNGLRLTLSVAHIEGDFRICTKRMRFYTDGEKSIIT